MIAEVAVLCAQVRSVYRSLPGCDVYDRARDARRFRGGKPVVAHPPCRLWFKLSHFAKCDDPEAEKALGHFCVKQVQTCGGVLEHPAHSRLFFEAGLPRPGCYGAGGFTVGLPQWWFGHPSVKDTWLFVVGVSPSSMPAVPLKMFGTECRGVEFLSKLQREATPENFARWLVELARLSVAQ